MRTVLSFVLCVFGLLSVAQHADAQRRLDTERFHPAMDQFGFLGFDGSTTPGHKRWAVSLWTHYSKRPVTAQLVAGDPNTSIIDHRISGDMQFQIGFHGLWSIGIDLPFVYHQFGNEQPLNDGLGPLTGSALGDPRFTGKVRLYGTRTDPNQERPDGPGVALLVRLPAPIGSRDSFSSNRQFVFETQAIGDFHILGAGIGAMIGHRFRDATRRIGTADLEQEMLYAFGIKLPIPWVANLMGLVELRGSTSFRGKSTNSLEGDLGASYSVGDFHLRAAIGTGFVRGLGTPSFRAIVGVTFSPKSKDIDNDGIADAQDECPRLPEDLDGFEDQDGCMDPDNDNDFIPDADDRCPNEEALEGRDEDEDGCTDP